MITFKDIIENVSEDNPITIYRFHPFLNHGGIKLVPCTITKAAAVQTSSFRGYALNGECVKPRTPLKDWKESLYILVDEDKIDECEFHHHTFSTFITDKEYIPVYLEKSISYYKNGIDYLNEKYKEDIERMNKTIAFANELLEEYS